MILRFSLAAVLEQESGIVNPLLQGSYFLWIALGVGVLGLLFAFVMARSVLSSDAGTPEMQAISNAIREGAEAFMSRQYTTIALIAVVLAAALYIGYRLSPFTAPLAGKVV